jgi:hypothetical protein
MSRALFYTTRCGVLLSNAGGNQWSTGGGNSMQTDGSAAAEKTKFNAWVKDKAHKVWYQRLKDLALLCLLVAFFLAFICR